MIQLQPFTKANCDQRSLRIWVKAFIELMPVITKEYKDQELIDLLLFQLPWLCYGLGFEYRVSQSGGIVRKSEQPRRGLNDAASIGFHSNLSGSLKATSDANVSLDGGKGQNSQSDPLLSQPVRKNSETVQRWPFGPSYIHGC